MDIHEAQALMDAFIENLILSGWNRKKTYEFIFYYARKNLSSSDHKKIPEIAFDYLGNIESSIIGHCSHDSFLIFPGEPTDTEELIAHIRGEKWKIDIENPDTEFSKK